MFSGARSKKQRLEATFRPRFAEHPEHAFPAPRWGDRYPAQDSGRLREVPDLARAEIIHHQAAAAADRGLKLILGKAPTGWSRAFDDPIDQPRGRQLVTLEDIGNYITKLPKAEHSAPEWQDLR
jgi:hypothetical protein